MTTGFEAVEVRVRLREIDIDDEHKLRLEETVGERKRRGRKKVVIAVEGLRG